MENQETTDMVGVFLQNVALDYGDTIRKACEREIAKGPPGNSFQQMDGILREVLSHHLDSDRAAASLNTPFRS